MPASAAGSRPIADQSSCSPPWAIKVRKRSRNRLPSGMGTRSRLGGCQGQANVFLSELRREPGRGKTPADDQLAIGFVDRRIKQR